uniref:RING-type domain-containing protein n=1 Tax=viral metagenome TaxID=1070528 RepID=A0A6C0ICM9_9ZZZZ
MSNYVNPPAVTDTCPVCLDDFKTLENAVVPDCCRNPLCVGCRTRCKACPMCRAPFPIVYTEQHRIIKSIHVLRQAFLVFVKHEQEFKAKYGDFNDVMFKEIHDKYVVTICELEKKLQDIMTPQSRNARQRDLQYQCHKMDNLIIALYLLGLSRESVARARPPRGYSQAQMDEYADTTMWQFIARRIRQNQWTNLPHPEIMQRMREDFVSLFQNDAVEIQWFKNYFSSYEECQAVFERILGYMFPDLPLPELIIDIVNMEIVGDELGDAIDLAQVEQILEEFGDVPMVAEPV